MTQQRPRWSGPLNCPPEQGFCGCRSPVPDAREDHLEGAARWAPFHRRCCAGRRRAGLARRRGVAGRGGRPTRAHRRALACAWADARAARPARPGPGRQGLGGDAGRRRGLSGGSARGPRSAVAVRARRFRRDGVSGDRPARLRPWAVGGPPGRERASTPGTPARGRSGS